MRRAHYEHEERLEFLWTGVPMLIFIGLFVWGGKIYLDMSRPPADALDIHAVGKQWMWKFQHPSGRAEINTLHLPLGRPVRVVLSSADVIHSFYVPAFRVKMDAVPGRYTQVWFVPTRKGRYRLLCAEYCGADHARMQGFAIVVDEAEYARWSAQGDGPRVSSPTASSCIARSAARAVTTPARPCTRRRLPVSMAAALPNDTAS